jgi:hypothetical protein
MTAIWAETGLYKIVAMLRSDYKKIDGLALTREAIHALERAKENRRDSPGVIGGRRHPII